MTTHRRTFLRRVGATSAAVGLAGCGGTPEPDPDPETPTDGVSTTKRTTTSGAATNGPDATDTATPPSAEPDRDPKPERTVSVERRLLLAGTEDETPLIRADAPEPGPTVLLVGGIHGDEVAGWKAATTAIGWEVDAGSLVVIPKATIRAVEAREREHPTWGDTNRHFPLGADPRSPPAAALWGALRRVAPDYLLDLHSSRGIYGSGDGGVGQCAFHTPGVAEATTRAVAYLNREVVPADRPGYEFSPEPLRGRYEMLVWKAHVELDLPAVLFEVTEKGLAVETQVAWTTAFLRRLLAALGVRTTER